MKWIEMKRKEKIIKKQQNDTNFLGDFKVLKTGTQNKAELNKVRNKFTKEVVF